MNDSKPVRVVVRQPFSLVSSDGWSSATLPPGTPLDVYTGQTYQAANGEWLFNVSQPGIMTIMAMFARVRDVTPLLGTSPYATRIGFTSPTITYEKMRLLNAEITQLDANISAYVADGPYKTSWKAFVASWQPFYTKYAGPDASDWSKLDVFVTGDTDQIAATADQYQAQYEQYRATYPQQKTPQGQAVPAISAPAETPVVVDEGGIPSWVWVLGLGTAGYFAWKRYGHHAKNAYSRVSQKFA